MLLLIFDTFVVSFDMFSLIPYQFLGMPCMKRVYRDKQAMAHWSAARNEERPSSRG